MVSVIHYSSSVFCVHSTTVKITTSLEVALYGLIGRYQCLGGTWCLVFRVEVRITVWYLRFPQRWPYYGLGSYVVCSGWKKKGLVCMTWSSLMPGFCCDQRIVQFQCLLQTVFSLLDEVDVHLMGQLPVYPLKVKIAIFWDMTPCIVVDRPCIILI